MTWTCCGTARWSGLFGGVRAPSTLGSFLRSFTWGNVCQLEKASRELLAALAREAPLLPGAETLAFIDIDSTQKRVYGHQKQGAAFGHTKIQGKSLLVRGLNALAARDQHPAGRAGDRRDPAARRERRLLPRRRQPRHRGDRHRPRLRLHRDHHRPGRLRLLHRGGDRRGPAARGPVLRHRPDELQRSGPRSPPSPRTPGPRSGTRRRSGTTSWTAGSPTPRSPRPSTPRSPRRRKASRSPPG